MSGAKPRLTAQAEVAILAKRMSEVLTGSKLVMPGLDPGIHLLRKKPFRRWIAGSSPAMTT
jgi:hypothetical protein